MAARNVLICPACSAHIPPLRRRRGDILPLADVEEEAIALALRETNGGRQAAAARLGISLSTLNRKLRPTEPERPAS